MINGGVVENSEGTLGYSEGSFGTVEVDGPGALWKNTGDLNVGYFGTGELEVSGGGAVQNLQGYIGYWSDSNNSKVTVTGKEFDNVASKWTNSGDLNVGYLSGGILEVTNEGQVHNVEGTIG